MNSLQSKERREPDEIFQPKRGIGNTPVPVGTGVERGGVEPLGAWKSGGLPALVPVRPTIIAPFACQNSLGAD